MLDADDKVQSRRVTTGALQEDGLRVIEEGLKPDDWVLSGGILQTRQRREDQAATGADADLGAAPTGAVSTLAGLAGTRNPAVTEASGNDLKILHRSADLRDGALRRHHLDRRDLRSPGCRWRSIPGSRRPASRSPINYPGASAPVVADTVAAPIEQQVNGVEGMLYMSSQMGNDGSYTLTVTFDIGTDVNSALVMVQNRVALAMPQLPTAGPEPGDHDPQEDARHLDDRQLLLARRAVRRHLPEQLRHDLRQGRAAAGLRGLGHQLHGPARLQHPRLARPAEAGGRAT